MNESPDEWAECRLKDVLVECRGGAWGGASDTPNVGVIRTTNISATHRLDLKDVAWRELPSTHLERQKLVDGDIVMTKSNSIERVGACGLFRQPRNDQRTYISANFCQLLRFDTNKIDPEYGFYWMTAGHTQLRLKSVALGTSSSLQNINGAKIKEIYISFPSLVEQRRIVSRVKECLERVEEIQSLRSEAFVEANALLPSMLNAAFCRLLEEYDCAEIGDLAKETRYGTSTKCTTTPNGAAILRIPNVAGGFVNYDNLKYCPLAQRDLDKLRLCRGDLLFVRTNGSRELVGRCAIFEGDRDETFAFASYLIRVRLAEHLMRPHFLSFFLNSSHGRTELDKRRRTSAGQFNINSENLRSIAVPAPPLNVQDELIERLRVLQGTVLLLRSSLSEVDAESPHLRESILRKAFAGEL